MCATCACCAACACCARRLPIIYRHTHYSIWHILSAAHVCAACACCAACTCCAAVGYRSPHLPIFLKHAHHSYIHTLANLLKDAHTLTTKTFYPPTHPPTHPPRQCAPAASCSSPSAPLFEAPARTWHKRTAKTQIQNLRSVKHRGRERHRENKLQCRWMV